MACDSLGFAALTPTYPSSPSLGLLVFLAVDHPRNAELVDQHGEARGPEGLFVRHLYRTVLLQRVVDALAFRLGIDVDRHRAARDASIRTIGRAVGTKQHLVADFQPHVDEPVAG